MASRDNMSSYIVKKLGQLWEAEEHSDIKILIGEAQFNCHKFHLSACSEFFRVLLKTRTGKTPSNVKTVNIKGISPETLKIILSSVYTGELTVNSENMLDLWHASHHLQIDSLVNKLEYFISRNITDENFFNVYKLTVELDTNMIKKSVQSFMAKNFEKIGKTDDILNLSFNYYLEILGHDDLDLKSCDELVNSVLKWVDYKPKSIDGTSRAQEGKCVEQREKKLKEEQQTLNTNKEKEATAIAVIFKSRGDLTYKVESSSQRKDNLGELMKKINLNDVSQDCLLALLNNDDIMECREARTLVRKAFAARKDGKHIVRKFTSPKISSSILMNRSPDDHAIEAIEDTVPVIVYLQKKFNAILIYMLDAKKTYSLPRNGLPENGSIKNIYAYKNQLYLLMAQSIDGKDCCSFYKLQQTGHWEYLSDVPDGSNSFVFHDNYIYCIVQLNLCRLNLELVDSLLWVCVYYIPTNAKDFFMSRNKLLHLDTKITLVRSHYENYSNATVFTYIDVNSFESGDVPEWSSVSSVNLIHVKQFDGDEMLLPPSDEFKDNAYVLTQEGLLLHVTHPSDTSVRVTQEENVLNPGRFTQPLVCHEKILYLFVDQGSDVCEPTPLKLNSFSEIRVVRLLSPGSNCLPIMAPKQWLTRKI